MKMAYFHKMAGVGAAECRCDEVLLEPAFATPLEFRTI